jgi:hypothetical protein
MELAEPDLIVCDHSPTALLAARGLPARKAIIGTGFFCPPDECPMGDMRHWLPKAEERLRQDEEHVLANANGVLAAWGQPPLEQLSRLFCDVDETFLVTLPELDHFPGRGVRARPAFAPGSPSPPAPLPVGEGSNHAFAPGSPSPPVPLPAGEGRRSVRRGEARYWGVWPNVGGKKPCWPDGRGKRVFAYLKPFPALPRLLQRLYDLRQPTIVYGDGIGEDVRRRFTTETLRFESEPLDLAEAGRSCDLAILNGNHGTTVSMLLSGRPTLQVPIALEQALFSEAVARLGAAKLALPHRPADVVAGLMEMLGSDAYGEAAQRFAAKYAGYDPQRQIAAMADRVEQMLQCG